MRYYAGGATQDTRRVFEAKVLPWPNVGTRTMFGCPCYQAKGNLFAFLVTGGIVLTRLPPADGKRLLRGQGTGPFTAGKKTVRTWIRVPVRAEELDPILPFVRISYEAALRTGPPQRAKAVRKTGKTSPVKPSKLPCRERRGFGGRPRGPASAFPPAASGGVLSGGFIEGNRPSGKGRNDGEDN